MKKIILAIIVALLMPSMVLADDIRRIWFGTSRTGTGSGSLDSAVTAAGIGPYDQAIVLESTGIYFYKASTGTEAENDPYVIRPNDVGGGVTSWILSPLASGVSTLETIVGGVSVYNLTTSTTLTREMMGGSFIGNYGASSEVTYTALPAFKGASFNVSLDQDQTSGSTVWVALNAADKIINQPNFVAGTSYYYLSGTTGAASLTFVRERHEHMESLGRGFPYARKPVNETPFRPAYTGRYARLGSDQSSEFLVHV